jgi:hypothetical protein
MGEPSQSGGQAGERMADGSWAGGNSQRSTTNPSRTSASFERASITGLAVETGAFHGSESESATQGRPPAGSRSSSCDRSQHQQQETRHNLRSCSRATRVSPTAAGWCCDRSQLLDLPACCCPRRAALDRPRADSDSADDSLPWKARGFDGQPGNGRSLKGSAGPRRICGAPL